MMPEYDVFLQLSPDGVVLDPQVEAMMQRPAVALSWWARINGVALVTARKWCAPGGPLHERTWHSGGRDLLIRPREPVPAARPPGPKPK